MNSLRIVRQAATSVQRHAMSTAQKRAPYSNQQTFNLKHGSNFCFSHFHCFSKNINLDFFLPILSFNLYSSLNLSSRLRQTQVCYSRSDSSSSFLPFSFCFWWSFLLQLRHHEVNDRTNFVLYFK